LVGLPLPPLRIGIVKHRRVHLRDANCYILLNVLHCHCEQFRRKRHGYDHDYSDRATSCHRLFTKHIHPIRRHCNDGCFANILRRRR
jgi:hypothetical protein